MIRIPADELRFHAHSFADPAGRLFWWNGELYRGLHAESAALFRDLLRDGTLERLAEQGLLIDTWPTDFSIDDYEMVVRHRVIPFASYPEEWCPAMLKDAALTLLDLLIELAHCGLTLKDSHPWNLLFDRGRPVYVDLTSITPIRNDHWGGFDEFCRFYRNPLVLMAHNQERIARRLLLEYDGVTEADVSALIRNSIFFRHLGAILKRAFAKTGEKTLGILQSRAAAAGQLRARVEKTKGEIEKIDVPCATSRGVLDCGEIGPQDSWTPTQRLVHELMQRLNPTSILDIGTASDGWYVSTAAARGRAALATSTDSTLLTKLYLRAHRDCLPILPIVMDFTDPTPARGLCSHWSMAAAERFKCDMILAMANLHRFVFERSLSVEQVVDGLWSFSKRWLIGEFVPPERGSVIDSSSQTRNHYSFDQLIAGLRSRFRRISILSPENAPALVYLVEK